MLCKYTFLIIKIVLHGKQKEELPKQFSFVKVKTHFVFRCFGTVSILKCTILS